jgi:hypothetical protein
LYHVAARSLDVWTRFDTWIARTTWQTIDSSFRAAAPDLDLACFMATAAVKDGFAHRILDLTSSTSNDRRHDRHYGTLITKRDEPVGGVPTPVLLRNIPGPLAKPR